MKIEYGNLLDMAEEGKFDIIMHGCNCFCTMGKGIAKEIKERYPAAYAADKNTKYADKSKLGNYTSVYVQKNNGLFLLVNAYTQFDYRGPKGSVLFEYEAFQAILNEFAFLYPNSRYGFPLIGCGLAGGSKEKVLKMIEDFSKKIKGTVTVVVYKK